MADPDRSPTDVDPPDGGRAKGRRRSLIGGLAGSVRRIGRDVVSVALGKVMDNPEVLDAGASEGSGPAKTAEAADQASKRINVLHDVAEKLRGAADHFIAAKLDELEARVDAKLDNIENRIDDKVRALDRQLRALRDKEIRQRLRLLKITLIFTVLVALLSLGYKWAVRFWGL